MLDRSQFIGGSECAAIFGKGFITPYQLWNEKVTGIADSVTEEQVKIFNRGKILEPYALEMLVKETDIEVVARNERYYHKDYPFLSCEVDFEWLDANEEMQTGDIKTSRLKSAWGEEYTDQIPESYFYQAQHGLMITGRKVCLFGVLVSLDDLRTYAVERDQEIIDRMLEEEVKFWELVKTNTPPELTTLKDFKIKYPSSNEMKLIADEETLKDIEDYKKIKEGIKGFEETKNKIEMKIKSKMEECNMIVDHKGKKLVRWKEEVKNILNQKKFENDYPKISRLYKKQSRSRVFRVS